VLSAIEPLKATQPFLSKQQELYKSHAIRKFTFFLDPRRRGRIPLVNLLMSPILAEFLESTKSMTDYQLRTNWFSAQSAVRVYREFMRLNTSNDGFLSRPEISRFKDAEFNSLFLDRVFEATMTYNGKMDYFGFIDLILATENSSLPESITYLFRIVDFGAQGFINEFVLETFLNVNLNNARKCCIRCQRTAWLYHGCMMLLYIVVT
jgi:serine/threonine-protein phosphatase 2A regulatory subunit B''